MQTYEKAIAGAYDNKLPYSREKAVQEAYNQEEVRLVELFRADIETEYGMVGHPKASLLFSKAWERGHSGGFCEIAIVYDDLVELIK